MKLFKLFFIFLFSISLVSANQKLDKVSLQLLWKNQFEFAGFYIAKEKGFYKDEGLDVQIKEFSIGSNITKDVEEGISTFGIGYPSIILDKSNGSNVVLLNAIYQSSPHVFITLKSSGIKSLQDFRNKKMMIEDNTIKTATLLSMLYAQNINVSDMKTLVKSSFNINDLISGKIDIFSAYISNEIYKLDQAGIEYDIWNPGDYGFDFYNDILFTSNNELKNNPKRVKSFQEASLKGWKYAFDNIEETVNLILNKYNTQNKTKEALLYEAKILKKLAYSSSGKLGEIEKNRVQRIYDVYNLMGLAKHKIDLNEFVVDTPVNKKVVFSLTNKEREYINNTKIIRMCNNPNWKPIEFNDKYNQSNGISIDTIKLIESKLYVKFQTVPTTSWSQSQEFLRDKKCDILPAAIKTQKREKYANFTKPYLNYKLAIITKDDKPFINGIEDIIDKSISRKKGSGLIHKLKAKYPNINIVETKDYLEALQKVSKGEVYCTIATLPVASYYINEFALNNLHIAGYTSMTYNLSIAVRDDNLLLLSILDKSLNNITVQEEQEIYEKWANVTLKEQFDYTFIWNIVIVMIVMMLFFVYRQNLLKQNNKNLRKLVEEKTYALKEINENLEQRIVIEVDKSQKREKQLFEATKMAQMGEMIGNIAHQWRQPLSVISTSASGMRVQKEYEILTDDKFYEACDMIVKTTTHLSKTIDTFRDFIKEKKEEKQIILQDRIDIAIDITKVTLRDAHITMINNINYDDPIEHIMTVGELSQVIINIINNAKDILIIKKIEEPIITVNLKKQNDIAIISITDNGGGIPLDVMPKIFEPYFTTKHKQQGTGLGLHMSYKIVTESLNGKLYAKNIGNNAVFYIEFPIKLNNIKDDKNGTK